MPDTHRISDADPRSFRLLKNVSFETSNFGDSAILSPFCILAQRLCKSANAVELFCKHQKYRWLFVKVGSFVCAECSFPARCRLGLDRFG